ncbi:MAG: metallophosphoesterase [Planctomycetales bacterium]|nr:metallophosphoesterase [Planctomycetales bacterium]
MIAIEPWVTSLVVLMSNCGFWLFCFNRLNSMGLERRLTKRLEKLVIFVCFAVPCLIVAVDVEPLEQWLWQSNHWWPGGTWLAAPWGIFCLTSAAMLGPIWLESRRWMWPPPQLLDQQAQHYHVAQHIVGRSTGDWQTALLDRIPGNQITQLEVNRKQLQLVRNLPGIDGLRIAHLSDLHFTGQLALAHYHFVIERVLELEPDLIVITGDIIDCDHCLGWIEPLLGRLQARLGCSYLLGNHDQRIAQVSDVTRRLDSLGHFDLGAADQHLITPQGGRLFMTGNERPWFERHATQTSNTASAATLLEKPTPADVLRLGLSHTPDNIDWARQQQLDLLLAGHTHGGQVHLPGIGPLVAPSRYGSRFASGVFYREPVLMHVSRGLSGTHPLRWRCLPEISLITLRTP